MKYHKEWNTTNNEIPERMKYHKERNTTKNEIQLRTKCNKEWNTTKNEIQQESFGIKHTFEAANATHDLFYFHVSFLCVQCSDSCFNGDPMCWELSGVPVRTVALHSITLVSSAMASKQLQQSECQLGWNLKCTSGN